MKYILFTLLAIATLALLITLFGMTLPSAHIASRKVRFRQTPQAIFDAISGPGEWRTSLERIEPLPEVNGQKRWKEIDKRGNSITFELVESTRPLRRVTRIADDSLPFGGTWTLQIAPAPGGSLVSITEHGEVKNPLFRFLSKFVMGHYQSMDLYLGDLAKRFDERLILED